MTAQPSKFVTRRNMIATSTVLLASVAGCSTLTSGSSKLDLTLFNQTDILYTVEMSLFHTGSDRSRSEARVYSESIDVDPQGEAQREDVAESQQYLVKFELFRENSRLTDEDHIHFYPTDDAEDDSLAFNIHQPGVMTRRV